MILYVASWCSGSLGSVSIFGGYRMVSAFPSAISVPMESARGSEIHSQVLHREFTILFTLAIRKKGTVATTLA